MFCWSAFRATFSPEAFSIRDATWDFCSSNRAFSSSNKACTIRFTSFIKFFSTFLVSLGFVFLAQMDKSHRKCATFYSIALVTNYTASYSVRQSLKKGKLQKKKQKDPVAYMWHRQTTLQDLLSRHDIPCVGLNYILIVYTFLIPLTHTFLLQLMIPCKLFRHFSVPFCNHYRSLKVLNKTVAYRFPVNFFLTCRNTLL